MEKVREIQIYNTLSRRKVVFRQKQELELIDKRFIERYYPQNVGSEASGANADAHIAYYGEVVNAYIVE